MKITFICAVFPPEPAPAGIMAEQLATRLAQDGHSTTMVVPFPNRPEGLLYPGFRRRLRARSLSTKGYTVVHCAHWLIGRRRRMVNRLLENITFGLSSTWAALKEGRPDLFIIETWAFFGVSLPAMLARLWGVPYIYYVQDLLPEAAEQSGLLNPKGRLVRMFRSWDRALCLRSARTLVISERMRQLLARNRKLPCDKISVISNWIDESIFPVWSGGNGWRHAQGISDDTFVVIYAGTLGYVSGAEVLVEVAEILRAEPRILLLCVGEGVRKDSMIGEAARLKLENIRFLPFQSANRVPEIQASCQIALLTMHPNHCDSSVPSKLISYLAASRPVICSVHRESTAAEVVLEAGAGLVVDPGEAQGIAQAILRLMGDPQLRNQMGNAARQHFERHFTLEQAHKSFDLLFASLART